MSADGPPGPAFQTAGERFLATQLDLLAPGSIVVFDLDNTLFDTRPRTLASATDFDALNVSRWFAALELAQVRHDGRATARCPELPPPPEPVIASFGAHWDDYFWRPESLALDTPIASVVRWAQLAREHDLDVRYLTGRVAYLQAASHEALRRIGLEPTVGALVCKPDLSVRTGPWKCDVLAQWQRERERPIGWFMTEGRRDLACLQATAPEVPGVLLDCSFESLAISLHPDTPTLPRAF